jgi:hypothetical protein
VIFASQEKRAKLPASQAITNTLLSSFAIFRYYESNLRNVEDIPMKKKAIWWVSPSLLEPIDGPWGCMRDFGHDPVAAWRAIIDWAVDLRVDRIITGIEPFMTDRVYVQWPFHYICHFPGDPMARCFDEATIDRHIKTVRAIAAYGLEKGVKIMIHSYNLIAPEQWVNAHPSMAEKLGAIDDPAWGTRFHNDRLGFLVSNICWNEPEYKAFMIRCWRELFANIPELAGMMITAGEFNYCGCKECTGGDATDLWEGYDEHNAPEEQKKEGTRKEQLRMQMCMDFIQTFKSTLDDLGKETIVRTWVMEGAMDRMPGDCEYAVKYSVFDACRAGPDPVAQKWIESGHRVWMTKAIEAENCGPVIWHDEDWCRQTAGKLNRMQSVGCILHINLQWGHRGHCASLTASRNITRMLESLEPGTTEQSSLEDFRRVFGNEVGKKVVEAAKRIAGVPLHMTTLVHLKREGFTYGLPPWFDGDWQWPGVLGHEGYEPPPWANPDALATLTEMFPIVKSDPSALDRLIDRPEHSVFSCCDEIAAKAHEGVSLLTCCPMPESPEARSEMQVLIASGHIAERIALEHGAVLRARLSWELVKTLPVSDPRGIHARERAIEWYARGIQALQRQLGWAMTLTRIYPDVIHHVVEPDDGFMRFSLAVRMKLRREELKRIQTVTGPDIARKMTIDLWDFIRFSRGKK